MTDKRGDVIEATDAPVLREKPEWLQKRLKWFGRLRFGLFIHWAPYCQWDCIESWPLVPADEWARPDDMKCWVDRGKDLDRFSRDYWALNQTFNPTEFDPNVWADVAESACMQYLTFTTKHHDGFCMYDTATTDYRITHPDCPFHDNQRSNVVSEVFDAFRRRDMAISCYFSKSDWHSPHYWSPDSPPVDRNPNYDTHADPERWEKFVQFVHAQIDELMTGYGPIDVLWLDGGQVRPPDQDIRMAEIAEKSRASQPGLIMADRTVGNDYEDIITPEQEIPDEALNSAWESCLTLGSHWKYVENDHYKSADQVISMLTDTVAKGGNLSLGVGPDPLGRIPDEAKLILEQVGDWIRANREVVFGVR